MIVLHGGPGAPGSVLGLAELLAADFRVVEPFQRGSGSEPLTVARHVEDLQAVIAHYGKDERPAIVGWSWGAMLGLAHAAAYPQTAHSQAARPLVLVSCGTFDHASRAQLRATLETRTDDELRGRLLRLADEFPDPGKCVAKHFELTEHLYDYDPLEFSIGYRIDESFDFRAHTETWDDMLRLQAEGVYPKAFEDIRSPVLMLHGVYDPHPGEITRKCLQPYIPQLEYRQWDHCGHSPWKERHVRDEFYGVLRDWLFCQD